MGDSTDENGWGLPSAAFRHSLCPALPPPWPPQRPDLIPPWQNPAERQRAVQAAAEAERARAEEEETLQFIRDYVQALRDWRKEIVFHWGDHVIGRTTISLFKNSPAGEPGGQATTDTVPNDGNPEQIVVTTPRPAAPSRSSAGSGFSFSLISSAHAQEVPETEADPALEEEVARNEEVLRAREIALEREALAQRADLPTAEGDREIKAAVANQPNPLAPFLTPQNPAVDALAARLRAARTDTATASAPVHREEASDTLPAGDSNATLANGWSVTSPRGLGVSTGPVPPGYTTVSRWVSPNEAAAWIDNGGTAIPADIGAGGRVYVTTLKAPQPGGTGPIRIDFAVPERTLNMAGNAEWFQIFQPVQSTPIYNVQIFVPPGVTIPR
jgi:hypothetical protein